MCVSKISKCLEGGLGRSSAFGSVCQRMKQSVNLEQNLRCRDRQTANMAIRDSMHLKGVLLSREGANQKLRCH